MATAEVDLKILWTDLHQFLFGYRPGRMLLKQPHRLLADTAFDRIAHKPGIAEAAQELLLFLLQIVFEPHKVCGRKTYSRSFSIFSAIISS